MIWHGVQSALNERVSKKYNSQVPVESLWFHTYFFQTLLKPVESHNNHQDIDEAQVCDDWNKVYEQLLVGFELIHIDSGLC